MSDAPLICNFSSCRKKLSNQACVTSCSHIFCSEHTQVLTKNFTCLACGTRVSNDLGVVCVDLNPTEQYKTMILTGLSPEQIMEIASRAIGFYVYQMNYNNQNKDASLRAVNEQLDELKDYCSSLTSKFKTDILKERKKAENLKGELEEKIKEIEIKQQQVAQSRRANRKLQMQIESQKREMINLKIPNLDKVPFQPPRDSNSENSYFLPFQQANDEIFGNTEAEGPFQSYTRFSH
ncbi:hypothetical protein FQA39_LY12476 [Lamprigera yunnana]|nr:hypothetical protein FQA39_LY12476 [Lamprigera yunnana]